MFELSVSVFASNLHFRFLTAHAGALPVHRRHRRLIDEYLIYMCCSMIYAYLVSIILVISSDITLTDTWLTSIYLWYENYQYSAYCCCSSPSSSYFPSSFPSSSSSRCPREKI